jgi:hypothetical protein
MSLFDELVEAAISDGMALANVPGSSTAALIFRKVMRGREEAARDIMFDELRLGRVDHAAISDDSIVSVIVRYLRAAREGAARLNLRLLAKAVAGTLATGELIADEFLVHADMLTSLTRTEILVIAALYRQYLKQMEESAKNPQLMQISTGWDEACAELAALGIDVETAQAAATHAQRSGLIYTGKTWDDQGAFRVSPTLIRLGKTIDFEDAIRKEAR